MSLSALRSALVAHIGTLAGIASVERQVEPLTEAVLKRTGAGAVTCRLVQGRATVKLAPPRRLDVTVPFDAVLIARAGTRLDAGDAALDLAAALAVHLTRFRPADHDVADCSLVRDIDIEPIEVPELAVVSVGFEITLTIGIPDPALVPPDGAAVGPASELVLDGVPLDPGVGP